jgi:Domain of unknown function (DUF4440)
MPRISVALFCAVLSLSLPLTAQSPNVTGKWAGIFDVVHPDGSVEPGSAFLSFTQTGSTLMGTAGDSPAHQTAFSAGTITGNTVHFRIDLNPQKHVDVDLTLDGGALQGSATGLPVEAGSTVVVNATRASDDWKPSRVVPHTPDKLLETIATLDARLFDAYNTCDLNTMGSLVSDDLEFYHDKTGLAVGKQSFLESIKNNICNKTQRVIVPGTLEAHRLQGFGAMELVTHRFTHPGQPEIGLGEAKSIMLWRYQNGAWKMTRVISYDHAPAK